MRETWRDVVGYEGHYKVSNLGRVKSLRRKTGGRYGLRTVPERILRPGRASDSGHLSVSLNGKSHLVHRLVLAAFVGPCPEGQEVLHRDHTPSNNCRRNLKYGTRSENLKMDYAAGRRTTPDAWIKSANGVRK